MPQRGDETEPMMHIISWRKGEEFISVVIQREKHRPEAYFAEGDAQFVVSPGALDKMCIRDRSGGWLQLHGAMFPW